MIVYVAMLFFIGSFTESIPPAARSLAVMVAVYGIILAAKSSPWLGKYITGWVSVGLNFVVTVLALLIAVPSDQLYSWNTLVSVIINVLGSSGIHGMTQNIPPVPPAPPLNTPIKKG